MGSMTLRARLPFAGLAVLLPVGALCWLQYTSLEELEDKTRVAVRDSLRRNLEQAARGIDAQLREVAGRALDGMREGATPRDLAAVRERFPEVDQAFVVALCDRTRGVIQADETRDEAIRVAVASFLASRSDDGFNVFHHPGWEAGASVRCSGCHQPRWVAARSSALYVFRILKGSAAAKDTATFAGVRIRTDYVMGPLLERTIARLQGETPWRADVLAGPEPPIPAADAAAVAAGAWLTHWRLAGRFEGSTVHSLARSQMRRGAILWVAVLASLLAGAALMLRASAREARLAKMKSALVANISHELKTPLAAIQACAETLEMGRVRDPARLRDYHRAIHTESSRLTQLVENVLDFSRLEAGRMPFRREPCEVSELVREAAERQGAGRVRLDLEPVRILADRAALAAAVANLTGNALKYSPPDAPVEVRVSREGGEARIAVRDHGIGIAAADRKRIFEMFYRVNASLVHDVKGAGIGLALAKGIVEGHGGRIEVASKPGEGSTFTIRIPATVAPGVEEFAEAAHC